jgi:hypothetical protein
MNRETRLELIAEAVRYCQKVRKMGMPPAGYSKALREPIHFLWERREHCSKVKCARYRSKAALSLTLGQGKLIYDHAVPFRCLERELMNMEIVTPDAVEAVLERHCIAVLLTRDENARLSQSGLARQMPPNWDGKNPLARYQAVGIDVVENT